ncbi:MAG: tRNA-dihydrouridine synthase, partial [Hyphomicrobium sp.]
PPLDYDRVYRLKAARPDLEIIINGGIETLDAAEGHLGHVDGVMLGRAAYQDPALLVEVDRRFFGASTPTPTRAESLRALETYVAAHLSNGGRLSNITRHVLGLYHGQPRGRLFRRILSEQATKPGAHFGTILEAVAAVEAGRSVADSAIASAAE